MKCAQSAAAAAAAVRPSVRSRDHSETREAVMSRSGCKESKVASGALYCPPLPEQLQTERDKRIHTHAQTERGRAATVSGDGVLRGDMDKKKKERRTTSSTEAAQDLFFAGNFQTPAHVEEMHGKIRETPAKGIITKPHGRSEVTPRPRFKGIVQLFFLKWGCMNYLPMVSVLA